MVSSVRMVVRSFMCLCDRWQVLFIISEIMSIYGMRQNERNNLLVIVPLSDKDTRHTFTVCLRICAGSTGIV